MNGVYSDTAQLHTALGRVHHPIEEAATLPPACYTDEALCASERRAIFRGSWIGIGRADRWKAPGDYSATVIADVPTIVLRDAAGTLRAFANTCRHRGALLLEGDGTCHGIKCPFHGWAYKLDGRLAGAPRMDGTKGFDKSEYGLVSFSIEERDGFAFLSFDENRGDIDDWLGDFSRLHAPWSLGDMVSTRRREFEVRCNWKSFLEVFNEYYHLPYIHPDTIGGVYDLPDARDVTTGSYVSQFGATRGSGGLLEDHQEHVLPTIATLSGRNRQGVRYTWIFPNMTFAASNEAMWVYEVYPLTPGRTQVVMTACFPNETAAGPDFALAAQHYYDRLDSAIAEDIPALEAQYRGLRSPYAKQGRFSFLEANVAGFACWYADKLSAGLEPVSP